MSCVANSVCKLCRRENAKLFLKGDRCYTDKCAFERRPYPPGQHGQARLKFSEYALQLREKQKVKRYYGVHESQFRRVFAVAVKEKGVTGTRFLQLMEARLDNVVYALGYAVSRREGRQMVRHNHFIVNGKRVNIPSFVVNKGDVIEVAEKSRQSTRVLAAIESSKKRAIPEWLEADHATFKGTVKDLAAREQISLDIQENSIVEYYSR
ncbi:MAG: 30S ribosomal protein S4 [Pseudomonadota bacterium]|nr:30S ribosomal protein S4 [Pseudomonadota bacterium]